MRDNIASVAERGERLDALQDKTGAFSLAANFGAIESLGRRDRVQRRRVFLLTEIGFLFRRWTCGVCTNLPQGRQPCSQEDVVAEHEGMVWSP